MNKANALMHETSPYLLQHAKNPVNWFAWHEETLQKAVYEKKPILLSIGYSACHWCHVMARESFEDKETASLMNKLFINIKVDREERPDIDKIYQNIHSLLTKQSGGWPLTVFLMPDNLYPIFTGTYFPKEARYQLSSFKEVLHAVHKIYSTQYDEIEMNAVKLTDFLMLQHTGLPKEISFNEQPIRLAVSTLQNLLDEKQDGIGHSPKFPQPSKLEFLFNEVPSLSLFTFLKMAEGGLYDHLEGGFFRYTIDEAWRVPHFEKMLYDNAQLLYLYATASQYFKDPFLKKCAIETADWVIHKMQMDKGGYYSSLDADLGCNFKIITAWNALMIKAMAVMSELHNRDRYLYSAEAALSFIKKYLITDGRLMVSYHKKISKTPGFLDDYAFLLDAILTLLQYQWDTAHLNFAIKLANDLLIYFYDKENGGFFFTPYDQMKIVYRPKTFTDEVTPSGNAIAISALFTLGYLLGETKYIAAAEKSLICAWPHLASHPSEHTKLLLGLRLFLDPPYIIILRGTEKGMAEWSKICRLNNPRIIVFPIPETAAGLPSTLRDKLAKDMTHAYLCKGTYCFYHTSDLSELLDIMCV